MSMVHIPHDDVRAGLQLTLAVPAVLDLADGGVVDELPPQPIYAIVRVVVRGRPVGAIADSSTWELEAEIDVYSDYQGTQKALAIANVIAGLLNLQPLTVDGWRVIEMSVQAIVPIEGEVIADKKVNRWQVPVLIHVERAA